MIKYNTIDDRVFIIFHILSTSSCILNLQFLHLLSTFSKESDETLTENRSSLLLFLKKNEIEFEHVVDSNPSKFSVGAYMISYELEDLMKKRKAGKNIPSLFSISNDLDYLEFCSEDSATTSYLSDLYLQNLWDIESENLPSLGTYNSLWSLDGLYEFQTFSKYNSICKKANLKNAQFTAIMKDKICRSLSDEVLSYKTNKLEKTITDLLSFFPICYK